MKWIDILLTGVFLGLFALMIFTGPDSSAMVLSITFLPFVPINYLILKHKGYRVTFLFLVLSWFGTIAALLLPKNPDKEQSAYSWEAQNIKTKKERKEKRKFFDQDPYIKQFIDEGLFTVFSESDTLTVVNVADAMYSAFIYEQQDGCQIGIVLSADDVKRIMQTNDSAIYDIIKQHKNDLVRYLWIVDEKALNNFRNVKAQTLAEGPSPDIDIEMEYELRVRKRY